MLKPHFTIRVIPGGKLEVLAASLDGDVALKAYKENSGEVYLYRMPTPDRYKATPQTKAGVHQESTSKSQVANPKVGKAKS